MKPRFFIQCGARERTYLTKVTKAGFIVAFTGGEEWQVREWVCSTCPGLSSNACLPRKIEIVVGTIGFESGIGFAAETGFQLGRTDMVA